MKKEDIFFIIFLIGVITLIGIVINMIRKRNKIIAATK